MAIGAIWGDIWNEAIWDNPIWNQGVAPVLNAAVISFAGDQIRLQFSKSTFIGSGGSGGFTLNMSGGASTMTYSSGAGSPNLIYTLSRAIASNETGTLDYTQPGDGLEDTLGTDVATFASFAVSVGSEARHTRTMQHTRTSLTFMETDLYHNDPTLEHND